MLRNHLLAALYALHPERFRRLMKPVSFGHGDVLAEAGKPSEHVVFPRSGLISVVVDLEDGSRVEAGMVGRHGAVGTAPVFGAEYEISTAYAQIPGTGWSVQTSELVEIAERDAGVRGLLFRNEHYLLAQAEQVAACNAKHRISERLAKWLLHAQDECGHDELQITQDYLAQMLGVQRASVSVLASGLQEADLVRYRRGHVAIADRDGLERQACECYAALRRSRTQMFAHEAAALAAV